MQSTITPGKRKMLTDLVKGRKPAETKDRNYKECLEFLIDFRKYAEAICTAVGHHLQPTSSNVHKDKYISTWDSIPGVGIQIEIIDEIKREPGKDGNHHKEGRYFREILTPYREIAELLTKISPDFGQAYYSNNLDVPARFRLNTKPPRVMFPGEVTAYFDKRIAYRERRKYNRLKDFKPNGG